MKRAAAGVLIVSAVTAGVLFAVDGSAERDRRDEGRRKEATFLDTVVAGLELTVIGPLKQPVDDLQEDGARSLPKILAKERAQAEAATYADKSVYNLASIVVLAECGGKRILLTGDARGDDRPFTIHLTYEPETYRPYHGHDYPVAELRALFQAETDAGTPFTIATPAEGAVSSRIDLLEPLGGP